MRAVAARPSPTADTQMPRSGLVVGHEGNSGAKFVSAGDGLIQTGRRLIDVIGTVIAIDVRMQRKPGGGELKSCNEDDPGEQ